MCLFVALFMTLFNVGMKTADGSSKVFLKSYSTHQVDYGWTSAFVYVHGFVPFLLVSIGLSIILFAYLHDIKMDKSEDNVEVITANNDIADDIYVEAVVDDADKKRGGLQASILCLSPIVEFFTSSQYRWFILLQLINLAVVIGVNVLYIFIENGNLYLPSTYMKAVPIALSIFKIIWSNTIVIYMVNYGIRCKLPEHVVFGHYIFALVYIYVLVPIATVFFTDVSCF